MNTQRKLFRHAAGAAILAALLLAVSVAHAAETINDPTEADKVLLERAKVAKQIVVEGQAGSLQADQERQALQRAQEGWQNMDAARAASTQRRAAWESAKAEAGRLQQERQARYWESSLNMERLLARQQDIESQKQKNLELSQERSLKEWTVVGDATDAGLRDQDQREKVRAENLRRYQESLHSGWGAIKAQDGMTTQQALEADRKQREQQLLQFTLGQWSQVINVSEEGRRKQDALLQAQRDLQTQHIQERAKEWGSIKSAEEANAQEQAVREQVRKANAERYQQQVIQDYNASRVGSQVQLAPAAAPGAAPADAPATAKPAP